MRLVRLMGLALGPVLALGLGAGPLGAQAQQAGKTARIGVLSPFSLAAGPSASFEVFRDALREMGYVEGQQVVLEYRWAEGRYERLPVLAAELVRMKVDVLLSAWGTPAALAAKGATTTIPIVFVGVGDAVGAGLVANLARPGGNVTGSGFLTGETVGKQLQLLKEAVPGLSRIATLSNPSNPVYSSALQDLEAKGRLLSVQVVRLGVQTASDVDQAFDAAKRERVGGLVALRDAVLITNRARLVELAAKNRLPVMYGMKEFVDAGGLMSFEPSLADLHRRAAGLVVKILKGAKPAELPVEYSSRFELAINLKTAQALGLNLPQSILLRAEQVIR